jgi:hypothetical protein
MRRIEMGENQTRILQMLAEGKINVAEAQRLLALINEEKEPGGSAPKTASKSSARYLRIIVEPKPGALDDRRHSRVNVRVPFGLIKAGIKLASLIPPEAAGKVDAAMKDKGMSFDIRNLKPEDLEEIMVALRESAIDVDTDDETIKVYAE